MLKQETQEFGRVLPSKASDGTVIPGQPGIKITVTQLPCSQQIPVFSWLVAQFPEVLPSGIVHDKGVNSGKGLEVLYSVVRRLLAAPDGLQFLQRAFQVGCTVEVTRKGTTVVEPMTDGLIDELLGARLSIYLEWLVFCLIFNFSDLLTLLPAWGKEIPSAVAAMAEGLTEPRSKGEPEQSP